MPTFNRNPLRSAAPTVLVYVLLLVAGVVLLCPLWPALERGVGCGRPETGGGPAAAPRPVAPAGPLASDEKATIDLYNRSKDSVVNVISSKVFGTRLSLKPQEVPQGSGTGFVWDEQGRIVTNYH